MKVCSRCKRPRKHFHKNASKPDGLQPWCVGCNKEQANKYLVANKKKALASKRRYYEKKRKYIIDYLKTHPCVDCGETDIVVLEFDHVRGKKYKGISLLVTAGSFDKLKEEIAKCDVRCANDHRRVTAKRAGYYGYI